MTITALLDQIRAKYNATGDDFFGDTELINHLYEGCMQLARECFIIEATDSSTTTVSGTQAYSVPTYAIVIKRLTYNAQKLKKIDFREDDILTALNQSTTSVGVPVYYEIFNRQVLLRPIPDGAQVLKFFYYKEPAALTIASTLEIPTQFHMSLIPFALSEMYAKDKDFNAASFYKNLWENEKLQAKKWAKKKQRGDSFAVVKSEEDTAETILGYV